MYWTPPDGEHDGLRVNSPCLETLVTEIAEKIKANTGFSVATLNLDHLIKLRADKAFRKAYLAHTHVTADGNPVVWLTRLAGQSDVELVPGADLIDPIARLAEELNVPIALMGSSEDSLDGASHALVTRYPNLKIALRIAPEMRFDPEGKTADEAIKRIEDSNARLVFLALGAPKQECFAAKAQLELPNVGFLSIGAGLDFISGKQTRAPNLMRFFALEWLWRVANNPKRLLGRYISCFVALPTLTLTAIRFRFRG